MTEITTIGVDLAKAGFQVHGIDAESAIVLRRQVQRNQMLVFFQRFAPCLIGMKTCAGAHITGRAIWAGWAMTSG